MKLVATVVAIVATTPIYVGSLALAVAADRRVTPVASSRRVIDVVSAPVVLDTYRDQYDDLRVHPWTSDPIDLESVSEVGLLVVADVRLNGSLMEDTIACKTLWAWPEDPEERYTAQYRTPLGVPAISSMNKRQAADVDFDYEMRFLPAMAPSARIRCESSEYSGGYTSLEVIIRELKVFANR